jgi:urease accessory protein
MIRGQGCAMNAVTRPFQPERGAYDHGHDHHGCDHDHGHAHADMLAAAHDHDARS